MLNAVIQRFYRQPKSLGLALCAATMALLAVAGGAAADEDRITPQDVAGLRSVGSAKISPDGRYVAYTLSVPRRPFEDDSSRALANLAAVWLRSDWSAAFITWSDPQIIHS